MYDRCYSLTKFFIIVNNFGVKRIKYFCCILSYLVILELPFKFICASYIFHDFMEINKFWVLSKVRHGWMNWTRRAREEGHNKDENADRFRLMLNVFQIGCSCLKNGRLSVACNALSRAEADTRSLSKCFLPRDSRTLVCKNVIDPHFGIPSMTL